MANGDFIFKMKIDHIQLAFPPGNVDKARKFFVEDLGMVEDERPPQLQKREGAWFRKDTCIIHVGVDPDFKPQKKGHPALIVENIESLYDSLESKGYPLLWEESIEGVKRFFTEDPFGNRIEFIRDGDGNIQKLC